MGSRPPEVSAVPLFVMHKQRRLFLREQQLERSGEDRKRLLETSTDLWHKKARSTTAPHSRLHHGLACARSHTHSRLDCSRKFRSLGPCLGTS